MSVVPPRELYFFKVETNYNLHIDGYNTRVRKSVLHKNELKVNCFPFFPSLLLFSCSLCGLFSPKNIVFCIEIRILPLNPLFSFPPTSKVYK